MSEQSIFHRGERAVQNRAGESAIAARNAGLISETVISGARPFISQQSMVVLGSVDKRGRVWASTMFGEPGFVNTDETGGSVRLNVPIDKRDDTDVFWENIAYNKSVGMLFIELSSRRRYRVNGEVARLINTGVDITVIEAYPNCPKYIQRRHLKDLGAAGLAQKSIEGTLLDQETTTMVRQADTLFVASNHPQFGADVSHRGGMPGYVDVLDHAHLRIPDYPGNCLYNTFGNVEVNPNTGLCVLDFAGSRILQLSGEATLLWDMDDPAGRTGGTFRFWDFKVNHWILRDIPQRLQWSEVDASPFNLPAASAA